MLVVLTCSGTAAAPGRFRVVSCIARKEDDHGASAWRAKGARRAPGRFGSVSMHQGSRAVRLSRDAHEATVAAGMKPRAGGPNKGRWVLRPGHVTASRFGFRQPVSDPRGPVRIAVVANKDGVFCVPSAGPERITKLRFLLPRWRRTSDTWTSAATSMQPAQSTRPGG